MSEIWKKRFRVSVLEMATPWLRPSQVLPLSLSHESWHTCITSCTVYCYNSYKHSYILHWSPTRSWMDALGNCNFSVSSVWELEKDDTVHMPCDLSSQTYCKADKIAQKWTHSGVVQYKSICTTHQEFCDTIYCFVFQ